MTTLYLDTEFNSYQGELISLALVSEDDLTFYAVLGCPHPHEWVERHVIPVLYQRPVSMAKFQADMEVFLAQFDTVHIVADWPEDILHFCRALITGPGMRLDTPPLTMEVRRDLHSGNSMVPHNALSDARAIKALGESR